MAEGKTGSAAMVSRLAGLRGVEEPRHTGTSYEGACEVSISPGGRGRRQREGGNLESAERIRPVLAQTTDLPQYWLGGTVEGVSQYRRGQIDAACL